jgi:hypothetical protein
MPPAREPMAAVATAQGEDQSAETHVLLKFLTLRVDLGLRVLFYGTEQFVSFTRTSWSEEIYSECATRFPCRARH